MKNFIFICFHLLSLFGSHPIYYGQQSVMLIIYLYDNTMKYDRNRMRKKNSYFSFFLIRLYVPRAVLFPI